MSHSLQTENSSKPSLLTPSFLRSCPAKPAWLVSSMTLLWPPLEDNPQQQIFSSQSACSDYAAQIHSDPSSSFEVYRGPNWDMVVSIIHGCGNKHLRHIVTHFRREHAELFGDAHCAMRSLMWHKDQKSVYALVLAIVRKAQTWRQIRSHRPLLAVWTPPPRFGTGSNWLKEGTSFHDAHTACHLPFQVAVFAMLITLLFARPCWPETCLCGGPSHFAQVHILCHQCYRR